MALALWFLDPVIIEHISSYGEVAQWLEPVLGKHEVMGSYSISFIFLYAIEKPWLKMKENRAFRLPKNNEKADKAIQSVQRCISPLFQRTFFLMFSLFQNYLNPQVTTSKIVNSIV